MKGVLMFHVKLPPADLRIAVTIAAASSELFLEACVLLNLPGMLRSDSH
jgi:hypothetical protein